MEGEDVVELFYYRILQVFFNAHFMNPSFGRSFLVLVSVVFLSLGANAQVQVESGLTLEQYVNDILLGNGIQAFNITYTGGSNQLGYLTNGEDSFSSTIPQ